jgi:Type II secretory pathway, pullulanase PulA and related glycosidases
VRRLLRNTGYERRRESLNQLIREASKTWHGVRLGSRIGAITPIAWPSRQKGPEGLHIYLILNAYWESLRFELPPVGADGAGPWRRWIDTSLDSPQDIVPWAAAIALVDKTYWAAARSVVVLFREIGCEDIFK